MARETLLIETDLTFSYISNLEVYSHIVSDPSFILDDGHEYAIIWDNEEFIRTAFSFVNTDGSECVAVGNTIAAGGEDSGELFAIVYDKTNNYLYYLSVEMENSHKVSVYRCYTDGIVIRSPQGKSMTYGEYDKILINRASGAKTIYSMGETEEAVIELDFSKGDMNIKPDDGKLWNKVDIQIPENLIAENISENIEIAGVTGSLHIPEGVEKTIDANFSDGDMNITPEDGTLLSSVIIQKPSTLTPANIVKGINIAGVEGIFEGGTGAEFDDILRYFMCRIDSPNNTITLCKIFYDLIYADTGSYNIEIPDTINGMAVIIDAKGV